MDKKAMLKQAAQILREQQAELKTLHEKIARDEKAELIVKKLIDTEELPVEQVFEKLSELKAKPMQDLEVMEKAAELFHGGFAANFGKLSDHAEYSSNPLLDYLLNDV